MTNKAMKVMDDFMLDIYTRLVEEAANLVKFSKKSTLSASEFQTATRLILREFQAYNGSLKKL